METGRVLLLLREAVRKIPSPLRRRYFLLKPFLTINQQMELLENRGLVIEDKNKTANYLLSNNYYSIINGYGKYFTQGNDRYVTGNKKITALADGYFV